MPSWYDQLIDSFTLDNTPLLISAAVTFFIGYLEYMYSFALIRREKKAPYPVWMHTFYLAHDSSWAVIMLFAASRNDWNWFLTACGVALLVWNVFEVYNITKVITVERQEVYGDYVRGEVSVGRAVLLTGIQIPAMFALVWILIGFMGEGSILQWFLFTNMLIAAAPGVLWLKRGAREGTRYGSSVGLAIVILLGTINTFLPGANMWVLAMPEVFSNWVFYVTGAVFVAIAAFNLATVLRLPAKTPTTEIPKPVW
ncbi:hypothetical protein AB0N73_13040 [Microbacterium sp. NPDC089189]|uniref:hypothetical protein n=1 Tax=Microbacterium sp. NPDC089189 TaxID=3154972 RepID=UPI00344A8AB5